MKTVKMVCNMISISTDLLHLTISFKNFDIIYTIEMK